MSPRRDLMFLLGDTAIAGPQVAGLEKECCTKTLAAGEMWAAINADGE